MDKPLLKITADYPITACCMDPAETVFILGTKNGKICLLDLFAVIIYIYIYINHNLKFSIQKKKIHL